MKLNPAPYWKALLRPLRRGKARADVVLLGALLTLGIFVVDLHLPLGVAGGLPYIAPVLLAMWLPDRRLIVAVAAACSLLTVVGLWLSPPGAALSITLTNRALVVAAIWTVAVLALQRRAFEGALVRSEAAHRAVLATTADGILTMDEHGLVASANPAAERIFGRAEPALSGQPFAALLDPEHRERFERDRPAFLPPDGSEEPRAHEMAARRGDGARFPVEVVFVPVDGGGRRQYTVTVRDITERRLQEQHLLRASDEERRAVGYSLHEELGQSLTGLGLISRQLARRLERLQLAEAGEASELAALLHQVDGQVQELFASVAPLEARGSLGDALDELATALARRYGVPVSVRPEGLEAPVDEFRATQLYQLIRDLLHAALEEPGAARVRVEAGRAGAEGWLRLHVEGESEHLAGWAERVRALAYRANLIGARVELADAGEASERTATCRWLAAPPAPGADRGRRGRA